MSRDFDREPVDIPEVDVLRRALDVGLETSVRRPIELISRSVVPGMSSHVAEIVTCRAGDGSTVDVLCKYGGRFAWSDGRDNTSFGHRGGVAYEVRVFREVLAHYAATSGEFYGSSVDPGRGQTWLFTRYRRDGRWPGKGTSEANQEALVRAAEWCARFHRAHEGRVDSLRRTLEAYDADYFEGWQRRAVEHAAAAGIDAPWLASIRVDAWSEPLLRLRGTVIHGEYYPGNILIEGDTIRPVDWESAAIAPGEIDLAALTAGWPAGAVARCEEAYRVLRDPGVSAAEQARRLALARLYLGLRWLGDSAGRAARERSRLGALRDQAELLGLV